MPMRLILCLLPVAHPGLFGSTQGGFFVRYSVLTCITAGASVGGVGLTQVDMKLQTKYGYGDPGYYYAEYKKYYVS